VDARQLEALPPKRRCQGCGGELRFSHRVYLGRAEAVAVFVCRGCGRAYRSAVQGEGRGDASAGADAGVAKGRQARDRGGERGSRKPLPDEGPPANPVIDEATAELLRRQLGG
jgi:hypothetical protein